MIPALGMVILPQNPENTENVPGMFLGMFQAAVAFLAWLILYLAGQKYVLL